MLKPQARRLRHTGRDARARVVNRGHPGIEVDGLKNAGNTNTLHGMYGIEILREIEYQHREGERCSQAYLN